MFVQPRLPPAQTAVWDIPTGNRNLYIHLCCPLDSLPAGLPLPPLICLLLTLVFKGWHSLTDWTGTGSGDESDLRALLLLCILVSYLHVPGKYLRMLFCFFPFSVSWICTLYPIMNSHCCTKLFLIEVGVGNTFLVAKMPFQHVVIEVALKKTRLLHLLWAPLSGFKNLSCNGRLWPITRSALPCLSMCRTRLSGG